MEPKRSGDINFIPIKEFPKGLKEIKHNGEVVLAKGEATGSEHRVKVKNPEQMIVKQDTNGNYYLEFLEAGEATHTFDHDTITLPPMKYKVVHEREVDYFADGVVRKVQD